MSCMYISNNLGINAGKCTLWDDSIERPGCDSKGYCVCEDDEDPSIVCEDYESDNQCYNCGADFNLDQECTCGD